MKTPLPVAALLCSKMLIRIKLLGIALLLGGYGFGQCGPLSIISDTTWRMSTVVESIGSGRVWQGASSLPATATYTNAVATGQPYSYSTIKVVPGTQLIQAPNMITFYRKTFEISDADKVRLALQMTMDDGAEVYLNGDRMVREDTSAPKNWKLPEHHILYDTTGTITNGYLGGQHFDYVKGLTLDTVLKDGTNELIVVMFNLRAPHNKGAFSLKMSTYVVCEDDSACTSDSVSVVSDSNWAESWQVDFFGSGDWTGATSLPAEATYTLAAQVGQPYLSSTSVSVLPGTMPIKAENNVRYFMKVFGLADASDVSARLRMFMDDDAEVYLNGHLLAREETIDPQNFKGAPHDILFTNDGSVINGFDGAQAFDWAVSSVNLDTVLISGPNTLVIALRNLSNPTNKGGFCFRLDIANCGDTAFIYKRYRLRTAITELSAFPNPTSGAVTVLLPEIAEGGTHRVMLFSINGQMLEQQTVESQVGGSQLDLAINYAPGLYLLKIVSGDQLSSIKLSKL